MEHKLKVNRTQLIGLRGGRSMILMILYVIVGLIYFYCRMSGDSLSEDTLRLIFIGLISAVTSGTIVWILLKIRNLLTDNNQDSKTAG